MAGVTPPRKPRETLTVNAKDITWIKDALGKLKDKVDTIDKTTTKLNTTQTIQKYAFLANTVKVIRLRASDSARVLTFLGSKVPQTPQFFG